MATITKTEYGTFIYRWRNPQNQSRSKTHKTYAEADAFRRQTESDLHTGRYVDPAGGKTRLDDWINEWHQGRLNLRPATQARDSNIIDNLIIPRVGTLQLRQATPAAIRKWVHTIHQTHAASTVHKAHQLLKAALHAAVGDGLIPVNPATDTPLPRLEKSAHRYLTIDEVHHLADTIDGRYRALVYTAALTGIRPGESAALTIDNLDLLRKTLHVERTAIEIAGTLTYGPAKTQTANRTITLPNILIDILAEHLATYPTDTGFVFTSSQGNPIRWTNLRRRHWKQAVMDSVGEPCKPHDLRHSHAAISIAQGVHPKVLSARMGHSKIAITMDTYGGLFSGYDQDAATALDRAFSGPLVSDSRQKRPGDVIQLPSQ